MTIYIPIKNQIFFTAEVLYLFEDNSYFASALAEGKQLSDSKYETSELKHALFCQYINSFIYLWQFLEDLSMNYLGYTYY